MKSTSSSKRKCSAVLAAGAGVAVCVTGGGAVYAATGNIAASNGGNALFPAGVNMKAFGSLASFNVQIFGGKVAMICVTMTLGDPFLGTPGVNPVTVAIPAPYVRMLNAGVAVSAGLVNGFHYDGYIPAGVADGKYIGVTFEVGPNTRYGWIHVVSATLTNVTFDKWGSNTLDANVINTLSDSVTMRKLDLSDGRAKLHWANTNEDGVARYEVQTKDASGAWRAVDSSAPGESRYSATVAKDATCRLVVEMVDGKTHEATF